MFNNNPSVPEQTAPWKAGFSSNDDYDPPWKDALTRYLPEFMGFCFPPADAGSLDEVFDPRPQ